MRTLKKIFFNRRRNWLILPRFQLSFIYYSIGIAVVVSGIYYASIRYFFHKFATRALEMGVPSDHVFFRFLATQSDSMNLIFLSTSLLISAVLVACSLAFSHRVAGPIYKLERHLRGIAEGDEAVPLKFRKDDYFPELAQSVNTLLIQPHTEKKTGTDA